MENITKITEKLELKDVEVQADPCKAWWTEHGIWGKDDCLKDCYSGTTAFNSTWY